MRQSSCREFIRDVSQVGGSSECSLLYLHIHPTCPHEPGGVVILFATAQEYALAGTRADAGG
ncbi:MAG: hypothetical protein ACOY3I_03880 [Verrucomicrobiota bacterium]